MVQDLGLVALQTAGCRGGCDDLRQAHD
jgi:hypothetical protein